MTKGHSFYSIDPINYFWVVGPDLNKKGVIQSERGLLPSVFTHRMNLTQCTWQSELVRRQRPIMAKRENRIVRRLARSARRRVFKQRKGWRKRKGLFGLLWSRCQELLLCPFFLFYTKAPSFFRNYLKRSPKAERTHNLTVAVILTTFLSRVCKITLLTPT